MSYTVHQFARFCNDPAHSHEQAVKRILRYLIGTTRNESSNKESNQGIMFRLDRTKSIDAYVDASFAGEWNKERSDELTSVMSRTGYVVSYDNYPIIWCSKLMK